jgi:RHS repeat-associated protein
MMAQIENGEIDMRSTSVPSGQSHAAALLRRHGSPAQLAASRAWRALRWVAGLALTFYCCTVHADWYYGWTVSDTGGYGKGSSGATKYYSYEAALQAARSVNNPGLLWQWLEDSGGYSFLFNPNVNHVGYYGLTPPGDGIVTGGAVNDVCTAIFPLYSPPFSYTGVKWRTSSEVKDFWACKGDYTDAQGYHTFNIGVQPYCNRAGYLWSQDGNFLDFYNRFIPPGTCFSSNIGHVWAVGFNPYKPDNCCIGNPVNPALGFKTHRERVYVSATMAEPLRFEWLYSTNMFDTLVKTAGWSHNFGRFVAVSPSGTPPPSVLVYRETGFVGQFTLTGGIYVPDGDMSDRLVRLTDGGGNTTGWSYSVAKTDETETYTAGGQLVSIQDRSGATQTLSYSAASTPPAVAPYPGLLIRVADPLGRQLNFVYGSTGLLASMTDPAGNSYGFGYDANENLVTIASPDNKTRQFVYENASFPNALTGIIDENTQRYSTYSYDSHGRVTNTQHAGGVDSHSFVFNADGTSSVTDPLGTTRSYNFASVVGVVKNTGLSQACTSCGINSSAIIYDGNGNVSSRTDFNSKKVCYAYDLTRNLETSRLEGALSSETCSTVLAVPPNRPDVRKITTTWNATYRLPATITEPAPGGTKATTFTYTSGNLTQKSITAPKNDGTSNTITRTLNWTYTTLGRMLTATDPNGKVSTYTYFSDTNPDLGKRGNVATITNAVGHVTQITVYDTHGRPLSITDPNGLVTTLTYDPRSRLASRQVGVELTAYVYDGVGQLTKVTLPDTSYVQYSYDAAHRLTQLNDGLGNKIVYTLDGMGNRVSESAYDPANNLARTRSRVYNALNQLYQDLGAQSQTTAYAYDGNFNVTSTTDPLTHQTTNSYDALNRLLQVVDPNSGVTKYAYDGANNLTQVIDANTNATTYTYDGLNNVITQVSPDTGTTTNTYDVAGNLLTKTDARSATATYTYDDLNRATQVVYSKSGSPNETHTFTYDVGANAKGRLTQVTDPAATTAWTYTSQGRVSSKSQTMGSVTRSVSYGYNSTGQLTTVTTPSGQQLGYSYTNNRVSAITINGQSLINGTATEPFGPLAYWLWGNGLKMYRDYDNDGRLTSWEFRNGMSVLRKNQSFDLASRIVGIADPINATASQTYQYDVLDRLTVTQTGSPVAHTQQFTYDPVGNRQNVTLDGTSANLFYSNSNRLQAFIGTISAGYLNGAAALAYTYNNANRLVTIQSSGSPLASYAVSALGQRVSTTVGGVTTLFVYDEQGHLLGEYDRAGNLIQETVWMEDLPVATLRPTGAPGNPTPINTYYVHADHLGSPRAVTRPSDNVLMWQWDNLDPFGANAANENPSGQGTFKYGVRFAGQSYDAETGTNYNYFRDYDPVIGRYLESDPIGLMGGVNTFAYVNSNPLKFFDSRGLAAQLCSRWFYPVPVPYARHCFVEYSGGGSSSYGNKGVHSDPAPGWWPGSCIPTKGDPADDCVKREMEKCKGSDYDFTSNNCCHCAERALKACGLSFPAKDWPNWPVNPGPPPESRPPPR